MRRTNADDEDKIVPLARGRARDNGPKSEVGRPIVRVHLLGQMRATTYLGESILPRSKKARAIFGYLCLAGGEPATRGRLAAMLWDRVPDIQARASFRQALRELTSAMGQLAEELVFADRESVRIDPSPCWIDAPAVLAPELSSPDSLRSELAALCTGELLEELDGTSASFDQWLLGERTRFRERLRVLLEDELRQFDQANGPPERRALVARRLIAFDPTHEGASRVLMRTLVDMGERAQALREYARCREALQVTLDIEPSPETHALYEAIRTFSSRDDRDKSRLLPSVLDRVQPAATPQPTAPARLRVGVLPFISMSSSSTSSAINERLALPLSQDIAAALARFRWFDVITPVALMSSPTSAKPSEDALRRNELDYIIDGVVAGDGKNFQISVRLIDLSHYARPVWSDRFELAVGELHQLNQSVTARIVGQIDPVILFIEGQSKRREHYGPKGLLMLAIPLMYSLEREKYEEAGRLIDCALDMEPNDAMILAWAAHWQIYHVGQGWTRDAGQALAIAQKYALKAIRLDPDNAEALGIYAHVCAFLEKDFDTALHYFDRALRLNPNLAFIWALSALTYCYVGEPDVALQRLARYRELTPFEPYSPVFENPYTVAYMIKGAYEEAVVIGRRVTKASPEFVNAYKPLIAALGHLGRRDEARPYVQKLLKLEPNFTVQRFGRVYPFKKQVDREHYMLGLRLAGIPEGL